MLRCNLVVLAACLTCRFAAPGNATAGGAAPPVYRQPQRPVDERIDDILGRMTLEEKIGQLRTGWPVSSMYEKRDGKVEISDELRAACSDPPVGQLTAVLRAEPVQGKTLETGLGRREGAELVNRLQRLAVEETRLGIPILMGDEGNHCQHSIGATIFPALCGLGCSWNTSLVEQVAEAIAAECASQAQYMTCLDLDVVRDPRLGRSDQNFGEDPYLVSQFGRAMVRGLQGEKLTPQRSVLAWLRAYPGVGDSDGGHDFSTVNVGGREMHEVVLRPWREAIEQGAQKVMVEQAVYDREPACGSRYYMTTLLRDRWQFQGVAEGDANPIAYLTRYRVAANQHDAAVMAFKAGMDTNLTDVSPRPELASIYAEELPRSVEMGRVTMEEIDRSVRRVLRLKFLLGLFERPYADPDRAESIARCPEHRRLALEAARQSIVLLKNENSLLPLSKKIRSIAVIGPNADDTRNQCGDYSPTHQREDVITILDGIKAAVSTETKVYYARGCGIRDTSEEGFGEALQAAKRSDIVVAVIGSSSKRFFPDEREEEGFRVLAPHGDADCGESRASATLNLLGKQLDLLKALKATGKPLVAVLIHGRAMSINWTAENANAIVDAWYPGEAGGKAVADVLFGDYNPGGKLPVSVPKHAGQLPVYHYSLERVRRNYVEIDSEPLYRFGFGLSYTTFKFSNLRISPSVIPPDGAAEVTVDITNTGKVTGDEVAQLYIRDDVASVCRPWRELRGFKRIHLKPDETKPATFSVGPNELSFVGPQMEWIVEPGTFTLWVAGDSQDEFLKGRLDVE